MTQRNPPIGLLILLILSIAISVYAVLDLGKYRNEVERLKTDGTINTIAFLRPSQVAVVVEQVNLSDRTVVVRVYNRKLNAEVRIQALIPEGAVLYTLTPSLQDGVIVGYGKSTLATIDHVKPGTYATAVMRAAKGGRFIIDRLELSNELQQEGQ
ncbi:MAG: hypothetical protein AAB421_05685 [Patescibacteria group bacterium]